MTQEKRILILLLGFLLTCSLTAIAEEKITLTTYYPAPFGEYQQVRLFPPTGGGPIIGASCAGVGEGVMQYSTNAGTIVICNGAGIWIGIVIAEKVEPPCPFPPCDPPVVDSFWDQVGSNLYPVDLGANVGIGTATPAAKLDVDGTSSPTGVRSTGREWGFFGEGVWTGPFNQTTGVYGAGHIGVAGYNTTAYDDPGVERVGVRGICFTSDCIGVDARALPGDGTGIGLYAYGDKYAGFFDGDTFFNGGIVPSGNRLNVKGTEIDITGNSRLLQLGTWGSGNDLQSWNVPLYINYGSGQDVLLGAGNWSNLYVKGWEFIYGNTHTLRLASENPTPEIGSTATNIPFWLGNWNVLETGGLIAYGNVTVTGDLSVTGNKAFTQPHPIDPSKEINYIAFEGRESRIFFDGVATLKEGGAKISVPEDFRLVVSKDSLNVILTPFGETEGLYVSKRSLDEIIVKEKDKGNSNVSFGYFVIGTRKGFEIAKPVQENTHFRPDLSTKGDFAENYEIGKEDSYYTRLGKRINRNLLISNGILLPNGEVNPKTAARLGWEFSKEVAMQEKEKN